MTVEQFKTFFDVGTVALLFLTFAFGTGAFITGNVVNERQVARLQEFEQKAEKERAARIKIEKRMAGRKVSKEQHDAMVAILKPFPGSIAIVAGMYDVDESKNFAVDILTVLKDAGWMATLTLSGQKSHPPLGLSCGIDTSKPAGQALSLAMRKLPGVKIDAVRFSDTKDAIGTIVVGLRKPA